MQETVLIHAIQVLRELLGDQLRDVLQDRLHGLGVRPLREGLLDSLCIRIHLQGGLGISKCRLRKVELLVRVSQGLCGCIQILFYGDPAVFELLRLGEDLVVKGLGLVSPHPVHISHGSLARGDMPPP